MVEVLSRCSALRPRKAGKGKRRKGRTSRDDYNCSCSDMVAVPNNELSSSSSTLVPTPPSVHQWFWGRSFYLRTTTFNYRNTYICKIPGTWLEQSIIHDAEKRMRTKGRQSLSSMFKHDRRHRDQPQFALNQTMSFSLKGYADAGLDGAAWAALGSTIYFFGGNEKSGMDSREVFYLQSAGTAVSITAGGKKELKKACCMIARRHGAKVVGLDGKVYIFGGSYYYDSQDDDDKDLWAEVFEPYPNNPLGQCRAISSPPSCDDCEPEFAVAIENSRKIIVGWGLKYSYEYDVCGDSWVKYEIKISINLRNPFCQPVAVGSTLYWVNRELMAYDLDKEMLFSGPLEDLFIQQSLETPDTLFRPVDFQVSLLHLAGDFFCVIWVEREKLEILHCTTIRVLKTATNIQGEGNLRASVLSCQTLASQIPLELEDRALMF